MGIDCTGLKPANETGEYFHNTVWAWPPLWDYVTAECSDILSKQDIYHGQSNSGHKINRKKATAMGKRLHNRLRTRKTHAYAKRVRRPGYLPIESPILDAGRAVAEAVGGIATGKTCVLYRECQKVRRLLRSIRRVRDNVIRPWYLTSFHTV